MTSSRARIQIEAGDSVLDCTLIPLAMPASRRPPPLPSTGLELIWPMELLVGLAERLDRKEAVWERTTRWRAA